MTGCVMEVADWKVSLYDLNDQEIMDISKYVDFTLELKLNDTSTLSFDIDRVEFEKLCKAVNAHPRNILYPSKTEIKVARNGHLKFGGIISTANTSFEKDSSKISVEADSYIQYFAKRLITKNYVQVDRADIAWDAIYTAQSEPNGDLGVTRGAYFTTVDSDLTCDYRDVKSIIQLYTYARPVTYDFEITPDKVFNVYPRLGSDKPHIELVYPQNIIKINVPRNSHTLYNRIIGLGSGIGEERLESVKEDVTSQITYRLQESKQTFNSVIMQDTLDQNTEGYLDQSTGVLVLPEVTVQASDLELDTTVPGDSVKVRINNSTFCDDVDGLFRIYGMKITVDRNGFENVSLNFYKPDAGGELE